jgi:hypothetical protein
MRGLLAAFIAFALLSSSTETSSAQRIKPKQHSTWKTVVQTEAPQPKVSGRSTRPNRAASTSPSFRAEDIIPDICKGCSS